MRSFGGRSSQFQRVKRVRPPRAPAATFPPAPVPVVYTESFDKADGALGPDLTWTAPVETVGAQTSQCQVIGNRMGIFGTFGAASCRAEHDVATPDMYAQVDLVAADERFSYGFQLVMRAGVQSDPFADPAEIFYDDALVLYVACTGNGSPGSAVLSEVDLFSADFNLGGTIASDVAPPAVSAIATWRIEVASDVVTGYRNGVPVGTGSAVGFGATAGRKAGIRIISDNSFATRFDNFEYGDL